MRAHSSLQDRVWMESGKRTQSAIRLFNFIWRTDSEFFDPRCSQRLTTLLSKAQSAILPPICQEWWGVLKFLPMYTSTRDPTALIRQHLATLYDTIHSCLSVLHYWIDSCSSCIFPKKEDPRSGAYTWHIKPGRRRSKNLTTLSTQSSYQWQWVSTMHTGYGIASKTACHYW